MATLNPHNSAAHLNDVIAHVELRATHGDAESARLVRSVRQLTAIAAGAWPAQSANAFDLALRLLNLAATIHDESTNTPGATFQLAELALSRLAVALEQGVENPMTAAEELLSAWKRQTLLSRELVEEIIVDAGQDNVLAELQSLLNNELATSREGAALNISGRHRGPQLRDYILFAARVQAACGEHDASIKTLASSVELDADVLETSAEVYLETGNIEQAIDRLRKALIVSDEPRHIREELYELYLEIGEREAAIAEMVGLLRETNDVLYWNILVHELAESAPERLAALRQELAERTPGLHVEILIHEGDVLGVARASRGKNFTAAELWRTGDYLATRRPGAAMKLYLRAMTLEGAVARSRVECETLGSRIERVQPFFAEREGGELKLKKAAKEILARHKKNIPLQREFERIFGRLK